jgi:hypothetical protein
MYSWLYNYIRLYKLYIYVTYVYIYITFTSWESYWDFFMDMGNDELNNFSTYPSRSRRVVQCRHSGGTWVCANAWGTLCVLSQGVGESKRVMLTGSPPDRKEVLNPIISNYCMFFPIKKPMNSYEFHKIPSKSHDFVKKKHHPLVMTNSLRTWKCP